LLLTLTLAGFAIGSAGTTIFAALALGLGVSMLLAVAPLAGRVERAADAKVHRTRTYHFRPPSRLQASAFIAACGIAIGGVVLVGAAAWLFTQPSTESRTVVQPRFTHSITLGYVAYGDASGSTASAVTAATLAETGSQPPLYSPLLSRIDFGFSYDMTSPKPINVTGSGGAALRITAEDGWERTIPLLPARPLSGPHVVMWSTLDLGVLRSVISGVEFATGSHSSWYDLTIVPVVRLYGDLGGEHIDETYGPEFRWRYDPARITPNAALSKSDIHGEETLVSVSRTLGVIGTSVRFSVLQWWLLFVGLGIAGLALGMARFARIQRRHGAVAMPARRHALFLVPSSVDDGVPTVAEEPPAS
jgi:hypothetical protein